MAWMQKLYETYEHAVSMMPPLGHTTQQAHVEVVLDEHGNFRRATVLDRDEVTTLIPCTEASGGRAGSKPINHPLCDKLQYLAGDFLAFGGVVTSGFTKDPEEPHRAYMKDLRDWAASSYGHPKLDVILAYVEQGRLVKDLIEAKVLPINATGDILSEWTGKKDSAPSIFRHLVDPQDAFVRWRIEMPGVPASGTWEDQDLQGAWIHHYASKQTKSGFCMVTGQETVLAEQHPAKIRNAADKAKLISANDTSGFTYLGRFLDADQACGVGFEVTQKAHIALRWMIAKGHASRNGDQVVVSWSIKGKAVPDPFADSFHLFGAEAGTVEPEEVNLGQAFARRLARRMAGYRADLGPADDVVILGLDSATPGRMSITYYRELTGSDFLDRIETWHRNLAWPQNFGKEIRFIGAPAPADIAEAAYGRRTKDKSHGKLLKATVERLLPCIVDGRPLPRDMVISAFRRTCQRNGLSAWEFEKILGITCALIRGYFPEEAHSMALDPNRKTRDYLFGRLLALAEHLESGALHLSGESRDTTAAKLMQRFADHPASTWQTIWKALVPYKSRLRSKAPGKLIFLESRMDEVMTAFKGDDFTDDSRKLTPEFLMGYHCERYALWNPAPKPQPVSDNCMQDTAN